MKSFTVEKSLLAIYNYNLNWKTNLNWNQKHYECLTFTADICTTIAYGQCYYDIIIKLVESKCCF